MRDNLALASVLGSVASVEDTPTDGHESVVEIGLERAVAVRVDDLKSVGVRDGQVVWGEAYVRA